MPFSSSNHPDFPFLAGGGEMGGLTRKYDWAKTSLGSPDQWPQSLRTAVSILLNSQFPMFVWWGKELTTIYNNSYKIIAGDKHPNLLGKSGREAWAEIWDDLAPLVEKVFNGASTWSEDLLLYINRRGFIEETYFTFSYSPILDESGAVGGLFCAVVETTEKVVSKKKVEESESRFRNMIKQASVAIMLTRGMDVVIESINEPMLVFLGKKSEEEVLGKKMVEVSPELEGQTGLAIVKNVAATGEAFSAYQVPMRLYIEGRLKERFFDLSYTAIQDESGEIGVLHVAIDVTQQVLDRKKMEESEQAAHRLAQELAASNEELRAANEEILASNEELGESNAQLARINTDMDNFIYTASHDLKAPISNIEGLLQALLRTLHAERMQSERPQQITALMQQSVERFKQTIASLTEVVKLQKENSEEAVLVNLSEVIQEVILDLEPAIQSSGAQLEIDVSACPQIRFSTKNMRSVIYNLLSNALKYHSPERVPRVAILCLATPEYFVLTVRDNGLGMEAERISQLFTMFKRFHTHVEGTGIGLYMIKKMIENAGGKIEAESQVGRGSTFKVYFRR
jgi:PAS domain S-box-containing protein